MKNQIKKEQSNNEKLFIGLFIGLLIGVPITLFGLDFLSDNVTTLTLFLLTGIFIVGIATLIIAKYQDQIFNTIFGKVQTNFNSITEHGFETINSITKGDEENARRSSKKFILEASAWYSWVSLRRWMLGAGITLIAAFAGLLGSVLLFRQNNLLSEQTKLITDQNALILNQNKKIDIQSYLLESQRRSGLIIELTSILESIPKESEPNTKLIDERISLPQSLRGRIVALSRALRPYYYVNISNNEKWTFGYTSLNLKDSLSAPTLTERPLSPERGQLLLALVNSNVYMPEIIDMQPDFSSADLRGITINQLDLSNINLKYADFTGADLFNVNLSNAKLNGAIFDRANLIGANFKSSHCNDTRFIESRLNNTYFEECSLSNSIFRRAILFGIEFKNALIKEANILDAIPDRPKEAGGFDKGKEWLIELNAISENSFQDFEMKIEIINNHPFLEEKGKVWIVKKKK
jgi:Uncharacterized low-complexity proteins